MDRGFLVEPLGGWRRQMTDIVGYADIADYHFIGCLGEPGIGKSDELNSIAQMAGNSATVDVLRIDLERCRDSRFVQDQIVQAEVFQNWITGDRPLLLILDNLDRLVLADRLLAEDLEQALSSCPLDRLFVRIACRTFDWSNILEKRMTDLFERVGLGAKVGVFELAPLTRRDVELAASQEGIDAKRFVADVQTADVVAFATRPVTLRVLLKQYMRNGKLPATTSELYQEGCSILCSEPNPELQEERTSKHSATQLLAAAARIAAVMMFSQKAAVWVGVNDGNVQPVDINLDDLVGNKESFDGVEIDVSRELVVETLSSGLFNSRGRDRFAFSHQTYAEYLAARYLTERKSTDSQILTLLVHPADLHGKLVPQLTGVAAWMASMNQTIFSYITEHDPQALLLADLDRAGGNDRKVLVAELLELVEKKGVPLYSEWQRYGKLKHSTLDEQLSPIIIDSTKSIVLRLEAIRIAEACEVSGLASHLLGVALDKSTEMAIRVAAVDAIASTHDEKTIRSLIPFVVDDQVEDTQDELKGAAMDAVYPLCLNTEQILGAITACKDESLTGSYVIFLDYKFLERMPSEDLPAVLSWIRNASVNLRNQGTLRHIDGFCDKVMLHAWQRLEAPSVRKGFAQIALDRTLEHYSLVNGIYAQDFREELRSNVQRRRVLLKELLSVASELKNRTVDDIAGCFASIPAEEDFHWLLDILSEQDNPFCFQIAVSLSRFCYHIENIQHLEALWLAKGKYEELGKAFAFVLNAVILESPEAAAAKRFYEQQLQWQSPKLKLLSPRPSERVLIDLGHCEGGHSHNWNRLTEQLILEEDATEGSVIEIGNPDITTYPGWCRSDKALRERIVSAGLQFLNEPKIDPKLPDCLKSSALTNYANSGFKALVLLRSEAPALYSGLSDDVWKKWFPSAIVFPYGNHEERLQSLVLADAYKRIPEDFIATIIPRLIYEDEHNGFMPTATLLAVALDENLMNAIKQLDLTNLKPSSLDGVHQLALTQPDVARDWMWDMLRSTQNRESNVVLITTACRLVELVEWDEFWNFVQSDIAFGKRVFAELSNFLYPKTFLNKMSDEQLVKVYVWLWECFPDEATYRAAMIRPQGQEFLAWDFRGDIPGLLSGRNTEESCIALGDIVRQFPLLLGLRKLLEDSTERLRIKTWTPLEPKYVLQLANNRKARLVASEADLMNVILETISELQIELQGHQPINKELWLAVPVAWMTQIKGESFDQKDQGKKIFRPKEEADFSDFVARYLRSKLSGKHGVIINREVQIRVNPGGKGERTDIHIEAAALSGDDATFEQVTVVIEAKGSWNDKLETEMETQLANQYLRNSRCRSGIYLVGYFNCSQWDQTDSKLKKSLRHPWDDLTKSLTMQANSLSQAGLTIKAIILDASLREAPSK